LRTSPAPPSRFDLLRRAADYRRLFVATLASGAGTYLAAVALTVDVFDRTGSGTWVSALLIAEFLPAIVIGLLLGPLVDRWSRRRLLIASDLVRLAVFCVLPFAGSAAAVVALAFVAGVATGFFRPAVYAGMPNLVEDDDLPTANALLQAVDNVAWMIGPVVGGLLLTVQGPELAYWLNAVSFLVSALLLVRIPARRLQAGQVESRGHWQDLGDGFRLVRRSRALVTVLVVWNIVLFGSAAVNVAEVVLAKVSLDAGDVDFSLLVGASGLGLTLGSLAAGPILDRLGVRHTYAGLIAVMALVRDRRGRAQSRRCGGRGRARHVRQRRRRRVQRPVRPARRARRAARARLHGDHVVELRRARLGNGCRRPARRRLRGTLALGRCQRRLPARVAHRRRARARVRHVRRAGGARGGGAV